LQIGKDDDKKESESEYQKYIYYASKGYHYYGEKVLYENLTFEIPPFWFFRVVEGYKKILVPALH
jgi:hypothetical protein